MDEKEDLLKYVEKRLETISKEIELRDIVIEDLKNKNINLAQQLVVALSMGEPLPSNLSKYAGVS